ncbi:MAG: CDP-diacylglycerol--glycerol-3-phosphate 3-phosphatidyltransferase [Nitrospirae bacterium CG_4_9_14_3_um_filter_53_35]|nr:MAG: CDP-diacylglycerol--glycerol-3-phosphate 3-phosphatidyltransferase [Nitrospirae bacterium CG2_30_53_67]PIS37476.1 MAG: CDP-diacylglycerol--glycerol-3-phosphate 3-phosphatidyltransferase [Nitrospirae bacterium CG08_land_8_20_14_0_20_52_24]PIV82938.1 MAG: CDP-diacylglycerol--glycerol-3-phosphate 3-phosphatidyltransferase [Nitrospirae bacterium CG17_big_fil_post_rev_8_21_14_2_50_50_9]PIW85108.1 MAG: CDP-diacylglycerol--glycerol-3-phosphate 3-phosphatidyltransferase [Nitrospirae bacterium CG
MNIPNMLSVLRIILIPFFILLLLPAGPGTVCVWPFVVFSLASITDFFDGYIARSTNQITKLGKLLDPIADKILTSAALIFLVQLQRAAAWIVIIIIAREFAVTGIRAMASAEGVVMPADRMGKYKMGALITAILMLLLDNRFWIFNWHILGTLSIWTAMILSVISGFQYIRRFVKEMDLV